MSRSIHQAIGGTDNLNSNPPEVESHPQMLEHETPNFLVGGGGEGE